MACPNGTRLMGRKKIDCGPPIELSTKHVMDRIWARCHVCDECGQKTHWPGHINDKTETYPSYTVKVNGRTFSVRRLVYQFSRGRLKEGSKIITECPNHRCLNPGLLRQVTMKHIVAEAARAGKTNTLEIRRKISQTKLRTVGKLTNDQIAKIRLDFRPSPIIAKEMGCSESYVRAVRKGSARRFAGAASNPWAGLGAR